MEFVTFKQFVVLVPEADLKNKTLKEQSIIICGDSHLYSIISKVNNGYNIGYGGDNYRIINSFMNKFGYSLELTAPKDVDDSVKNREINSLIEENNFLRKTINVLLKKNKAYDFVDQALQLLNEASEEEKLIKRPKKNRKRGDN